MARKQAFEASAIEPALPGGSFDSAPLVGAFVDDEEFAAGAENAAQFFDGAADIDCVFEGFGGVNAVERLVGEGKVGEDAGNFANSLGNAAQHFFRDIEAG